MKIRYLANRRRQKHEETDIFDSITKSIETKYKIIENSDEQIEGYDLLRNLTIIDDKRNIAELVLNLHEYDQHSFFSIDIKDTSNSQEFVFDLKSHILELLKEHYKATVVQQDDQSRELGKLLYEKVHEVENRMRNIVNTVMIYHYGLDWYSANIHGDEFRLAANPQNDWYVNKYLKTLGLRNSVYSLYFKQIIEILEKNTHNKLKFDVYRQIVDLKQKTDSIDANMINAIEKPKSYWEEHFEDLFNPNFLDQWEDLNNKRNVIAHNKLIVKEFYELSDNLLEERKKELVLVQEKLNKQFGDRYIDFIYGVLQDEAQEALAWEDYNDEAYRQLGLTRFTKEKAEEFIDQSPVYEKFREFINNMFHSYDKAIESKLDEIQECINEYNNLSFEEKIDHYKEIIRNINNSFNLSMVLEHYISEVDLDALFAITCDDFDEIVYDFENLKNHEYLLYFTKDKTLVYKDIMGNELELFVDFDFFYEAGGSNFYSVNIKHTFDKGYKTFYDDLDKDKYRRDDYPNDLLLVETPESITSGGIMTFSFGEFSEKDSGFYPETDDCLDIEYYMLEDYLKDFSEYLYEKLK